MPPSRTQRLCSIQASTSAKSQATTREVIGNRRGNSLRCSISQIVVSLSGTRRRNSSRRMQREARRLCGAQDELAVVAMGDLTRRDTSVFIADSVFARLAIRGSVSISPRAERQTIYPPTVPFAGVRDKTQLLSVILSVKSCTIPLVSLEMLGIPTFWTIEWE